MRKFFESLSPKVLAIMPMQRKSVWPATWHTSAWHVTNNSLCRSRGYNDLAVYGIPHFLPMNVQRVPWSTDKLSNITEPIKAQWLLSVLPVLTWENRYVFPHSFYTFHMNIRTNSNYFPKHQLHVLCNEDKAYVLWRTKWTFKYCSDEFPSSVG